MKLIYPYGADKIYLGNPVELFRDQDTGDYIIPKNATDIPPELNGEGMWRPMFNEEKQTWIETADQAYKKAYWRMFHLNPIQRMTSFLHLANS